MAKAFDAPTKSMPAILNALRHERRSLGDAEYAHAADMQSLSDSIGLQVAVLL
jgi:hypothetical protein